MGVHVDFVVRHLHEPKVADMVEGTISRCTFVRALGGVSSGLAGNGCRGFLGWESAHTDATAHDLAVGDLRNGGWGDSALGSGTVRSAGRTPSARMGGNAGSDPAAALRHFPNR